MVSSQHRYKMIMAQIFLLCSTCKAASSLCGRPSANQPDFDFFMLSMSYAPTFCLKNPSHKNERECLGNYGTILHGLWPNYVHGYPQNCVTDFHPSKDDLITYLEEISDWKDIAPEYDTLIVHEWCKHGTCSELSPRDYLHKAFDLARPLASTAVLTCSSAKERYPNADSFQCNTDGSLSEVRFRIEKSTRRNLDSYQPDNLSVLSTDANGVSTAILASTGGDVNNKPIYFDPEMSVADAWDVADGLYLCIKNNNSEFLWVNDNFAKLVGSTKEALIGTRDSRIAHVEADKKTLESGQALLNYQETISVPMADGSGMEDIEIVTQKGLLRERGGHRIIGITVAFHKLFPESNKEARQLITQNSMKPTGIGGFMTPTFSSDIVLAHSSLPPRFVEDARAYSSNFFLLEHTEVLQLHMLNQDEQWFYHRGNSIVLHTFDPKKAIYENVTVGGNTGDLLQFSVPHGTWFGAQVQGEGFSFVSCSLAPAWAKSGTFKPNSEQTGHLLEQFAPQKDIISMLSV